MTHSQQHTSLAMSIPWPESSSGQSRVMTLLHLTYPPCTSTFCSSVYVQQNVYWRTYQSFARTSTDPTPGSNQLPHTAWDSQIRILRRDTMREAAFDLLAHLAYPTGRMWLLQRGVLCKRANEAPCTPHQPRKSSGTGGSYRCGVASASVSKYCI